MNWTNIFFKDNIKLSNEILTEKVMDNISEAILNHLKMKTTGALLLTGDWGSGKTYHLKNNVFPLIEATTKFIPVIVSLYGETDKNNIAQKVLFSFFDKKGKKVNLSTGTLAKNIKNFSEGFPILKKYVDLDKLIVGTGENVFRLLPHDNLLICFDDLERMSEKIDVNDFLGIVNDLVENKGCKVLLIANEEEIKNGITFKEKTIEKTIHFSPKISDIFDSIITSYEPSTFKEYLKINKEFIISTLVPIVENKDEEQELKKSFSNIRSLKFSIEHFRYSYLLLTSKKDEKDILVKQQLRSLWIFTLSISIEFRKPQSITYRDKKKLDEQATSFSDINLSNLNFGNTQTTEVKTETQWTYSENFKRLYYNRLSENYIYFPSIYDLITSGKAISENDFFAHLDKSFNIKEGKVNPAHQILHTFLHLGYWSYSDSEFKQALTNLLEYCKKGQLEDIVSYLNAGVYLIGFSEIIEKEKNDIIKKIQEGLAIFLPQIKINYFVKSQFEMVQGHFNEPNLQKLVEFIKEKIVEIETRNALLEVNEIETKFSNDLESFVKDFLPENSGFRTPDKPLFHKFEKKTIQESLKKWQPKGIMNLTSLLKIRYLETSFSEKLIDEMTFLINLETAILEKDFNEKTLSNYLLKDQLLPRIVECKKQLQIFIDQKSELHQTSEEE
ncbi:hypothetical protein GJU43_18735 [Flavobacterium sp. LC2016-23]|uniref:hypothetical protein n=1 Tax=Flavobacterium sp. LC2016-23 TaxID=2666330 RepID=UPI0012AF4802|nr:hypothetical protein [Flavobacterium sp. LC2016-23]MRX41329.1 hypothetical protein [Flavobacterium sp. LC2016-23]